MNFQSFPWLREAEWSFFHRKRSLLMKLTNNVKPLNKHFNEKKQLSFFIKLTHQFSKIRLIMWHGSNSTKKRWNPLKKTTIKENRRTYFTCWVTHKRNHLKLLFENIKAQIRRRDAVGSLWWNIMNEQIFEKAQFTAAYIVDRKDHLITILSLIANKG